MYNFHRNIEILNISDNRLFDVTNSLKLENVQLTIQNEKLRLSSFETNVTSGTHLFKYMFYSIDLIFL